MNCDEIRRDFAAYLSGELNEADQAELNHHVRECPSCASELEALRNAAEAVKRLGMERMPYELENSVMASIPRRRNMSLGILRRRGAWALVGTVALTCALAAGLLFVKQPPLTAAQVVARAESNRKGLSSWHQKVRNTSYPQGQKPQVYYTETWAQAPSLMRTETVTPGGGKRIIIHGRDASLNISVKYHFACLSPLTARSVAYTSRSVSGVSVKDTLGKMPDQWKLTGVTQVLGRDCDVVEMDEPGHNRVQVAVDREAGIVMRWSVYENGRLWSVRETVEFDANQPIPQEMFDTDPPEGMPVVKGWSPHPPGPNSRLYGPEYDPSKVREELRALPEQQVAGCRAPSTLYAPRYVPSGYRLAEAWWMAAEWVPGESFANQLVNVVIQYANPETGDTLMITESLKETKTVGSKVSIGDVSGIISTDNKPYDSMTLTWSRNGLSFQIWASGNGRDEIIRVVESMQPLAP